MVRANKSKLVKAERGYVRYIEAACLSTDAKPTENICTGSLMLEVDTGDVYAFNEEADTGSEWAKIASLGGAS